jgi:hypothetical protein
MPRAIEGVHYYVENGRRYFTEEFHRERGTCCGCACRHCPWRGERLERLEKLKLKSRLEADKDISGEGSEGT